MTGPPRPWQAYGGHARLTLLTCRHGWKAMDFQDQGGGEGAGRTTAAQAAACRTDRQVKSRTPKSGCAPRRAHCSSTAARTGSAVTTNRPAPRRTASGTAYRAPASRSGCETRPAQASIAGRAASFSPTRCAVAPTSAGARPSHLSRTHQTRRAHGGSNRRPARTSRSAPRRPAPHAPDVARWTH